MSNDDKRSYKSGPIIAVAALLLLLLLGAYVGAYLALSEFDPSEFQPSAQPVRMFKSAWQCTLFMPALKIEKQCRGELWATWPDNGQFGLDEVE